MPHLLVSTELWQCRYSIYQGTQFFRNMLWISALSQPQIPLKTMRLEGILPPVGFAHPFLMAFEFPALQP